MVNREKRDLARRLIEKFLACEITNDDLVNNYPFGAKEDRAVVAIYERLWATGMIVTRIRSRANTSSTLRRGRCLSDVLLFSIPISNMNGQPSSGGVFREPFLERLAFERKLTRKPISTLKK